MLKLYVIRDVLVGFGVKHSYNPVIIDCPNDDVMLRTVKASLAAGAQPNELNICPEDKEVWCVGSFNQDTGEIVPCKPYCVARCIEFKDVKAPKLEPIYDHIGVKLTDDEKRSIGIDPNPLKDDDDFESDDPVDLPYDPDDKEVIANG